MSRYPNLDEARIRVEQLERIVAERDRRISELSENREKVVRDKILEEIIVLLDNKLLDQAMKLAEIYYILGRD